MIVDILKKAIEEGVDSKVIECQKEYSRKLLLDTFRREIGYGKR